MGKKELLAELLFRTGLLRPLGALQPKELVVLCYHRIRPNDPPADYPYDEGVFGPTQLEFERQVKWLKQNFAILSESELLALISNGSHSRRSAVITFDDGYADNYELAYPVLRAHDIPAIFFLCPGLIDGGTLGWWDLIAYLIKKSDRPVITLSGETLPLGDRRSESVATVQDWMKSRPAVQTAGLIGELAEACGVPLPTREAQQSQFMSWEQAREVVRNGVAIGSHTHTHPVLGRLDEEGQRRELWDSKAALERQLGQRIRTLAYPVGRYGNFSEATMRIAAECGYEAAFSFRTGGNQPRKIQPYDVRRIAAVHNFCASFAGAAYMPELFTWN
jgi:peptidoglycan/xylan/chitin deacetylase (PgdA/CDA1 family)